MRTIVFLLIVGTVVIPVCTAGPIITDPAKVDMDQRAKELQELRFGMFICWSFSTFSGYEWTPGVEDIDFFNPTGFDPDQWCRVARQAGMKYILFLTKHHDGFCLWDTQTTDRKVTNTKALKGIDVLAEVRKACDRHGLKLALYFSEGDWSWSGRKDIHQSVSRPEIKKAQLKELLTQYGPIEYLWMDRAVNDGGLSHEETTRFCKTLQPGCFIGFNAGAPAGDLRIGERGKPTPVDDLSGVHGNRHALWKNYKGWKVAGFTYPILEGQGRTKMRGAQWFYSLPENDERCVLAEKIYSDYLAAGKCNNIFSLDVGPDRNGRIRAIDVKTLKKVGEYIRGERVKMPDEFRAQQIKDMKFGMFICWSFSTFSGSEWTPTLDKDATYFRATGCDTDQWCKTAKEAGMGYILFLSKHHDGFCLWDTATTEKKVTNSPTGIDVLAKLRKSCDKYGIKLALYFSEGDWNWPGARDGQGSRKWGGNNPEIKKAQLKELLTNYGPIEFWWMDHATGTGGLSHKDTVEWMHKFQPNTFVGFNHGAPAGRICLREKGGPGKIGDPKASSPHNKGGEIAHKGYLVAEFTYPIQPPHQGGAMWFYSLPQHDDLCHSADKVYLDYAGAVKYGNIFSIDVGPNYAGRLRDVDVKTLQKVGKYIRGELTPPDAPLSQGKPAQASAIWGSGYEANKAFDGDAYTRWGAPPESRSAWLEVDLQGDVSVARVVIDEGDWDRVTRFELQVDQGGRWITVAQGEKIGPNRTLVFKAVKTSKVRLNILEATEVPTIQEIEVHEK